MLVSDFVHYLQSCAMNCDKRVASVMQGSFALYLQFYGHQNNKKIAIFTYEIIMHELLCQVLTKFVSSLKLSKDSASVFCFERSLFQLFVLQLNILHFNDTKLL